MNERAQAWRNALYSGIFFGIFFGLFMAWSNGWLPLQSGGDVAAILTVVVLSGGAFGLLLGLFMSSPIVPQAGDIPLMPGEKLEHSGFANHFLNLEGRGGRLALTNTHLVFVPHVVNVQRSELRIPRSEIASAAPVRTFGVVPNGLAVTLKSGKVEKFVVNDRKTWLAKLGRK
jgi:hypothetical protein